MSLFLCIVLSCVLPLLNCLPSYIILQDNVGYRLLCKQGWKAGQGLGRSSQGITKSSQTLLHLVLCFMFSLINDTIVLCSHLVCQIGWFTNQFPFRVLFARVYGVSWECIGWLKKWQKNWTYLCFLKCDIIYFFD